MSLPERTRGPLPSASKKAWRALARDMFALTEPETRRRLDEALAERVGEEVTRLGARRLLGYAALPDEPDLTPFYRRWLAGGGFLALPVWRGGAAMEYRRVQCWDDPAQFIRGKGGIREPAAGLPAAVPEEFGLVITPGRVFSETCSRMGRGAGCYDALFSTAKAVKVGAAYDFQIFPAIPADPWDVPVDMIVTPSRTVMKETAAV